MPDRRHGDDVQGDLVAEVADALTRNQAVQWERCARLAAPADRGALDNLRAIAPAILGRDAPGDAPPAGPGSSWSALARWGTRVLGAIAAIEVASALLLLPWFWGDYHREHGDVALFFANHLVGFGATAFLLLVAGRREPRAWLLGLYCLLSASQSAHLMLPAFLLDMPPPGYVRGVPPRDSPADAALLHALRPLVRLRPGRPVDLRPGVPGDLSPDPARRLCPPYGPRERGDRLRALGSRARP